MEKTKPKVTVAHLTYNYWNIEGIQVNAPRELQEGYSIIEIPGEGAEVQQLMQLAIINKATQCGLFNVKTITPDEYANAMKFQDKKNGK